MTFESVSAFVSATNEKAATFIKPILPKNRLFALGASALVGILVSVSGGILWLLLLLAGLYASYIAATIYAQDEATKSVDPIGAAVDDAAPSKPSVQSIITNWLIVVAPMVIVLLIG